MSVASPPRGVGGLLREWRQRRRLSQLDLAVDADVSARHLSFVETGRSRPSRELVLHLAEHLEVPLRERNSLLLAAGYSPAYQETPLDADAMAPVREAVETILSGQEPFPAVVVDRRWNLVSANAPAQRIIGGLVEPELLAPPANTLRLTLHPKGLAPHILNLAEYGEHLLSRLRRELALSGDRELAVLARELEGYLPPGPPPADGHEGSPALFVPLALRPPGASGSTLRFFSTIATFGTALDVTVAELAIEQFFPADRETAENLFAGWNGPRSG